MKEKLRKESLRITRKLLETKLCSKNLIKEKNTYVSRKSGGKCVDSIKDCVDATIKGRVE